MTEKQKLFIKQNAEILSDIYSEKLSVLMQDVLDSAKEDRDKIVDTINVLRTWLRETKMIQEGKEIKKTTFV